MLRGEGGCLLKRLGPYDAALLYRLTPHKQLLRGSNTLQYALHPGGLSTEAQTTNISAPLRLAVLLWYALRC